MRPQPAPRNVKAVKQRGERRTEKPVAQEVGGKVHKDGRIGVLEPYPEKQMHRIIGGKQQQRCTHDAPGTQVVSENGLSRYSCQQKIKAEEQHQRQRNKKRMAVYRRFHDDLRIDFQVQSYSKISAYRFILPPIYDLYPPAELPGAPLWRTLTVLPYSAGFCLQPQPVSDFQRVKLGNIHKISNFSSGFITPEQGAYRGTSHPGMPWHTRQISAGESIKACFLL